MYKCKCIYMYTHLDSKVCQAKVLMVFVHHLLFMENE